ncbi:putative membrane protein insertion efficiency factor [Capsicum annuum]|nr:putative membrane protein insertion efficiency factor [Capsicum annuum]
MIVNDQKFASSLLCLFYLVSGYALLELRIYSKPFYHPPRHTCGIRLDDEVDNLGVKAALSMLKFYKREISPVLPKSCRYIPTCSEYSMIAYKKYGVVKGTVLTAWRLCRCNPLGGSGFDPPRWFDEESPPQE